MEKQEIIDKIIELINQDSSFGYIADTITEDFNISPREFIDMYIEAEEQNRV